jgi:hypothetical protein
LANESYTNKSDFLNAIEKEIRHEQTNKYKSAILKNAKTKDKEFTEKEFEKELKNIKGDEGDIKLISRYAYKNGKGLEDERLQDKIFTKESLFEFDKDEWNETNKHSYKAEIFRGTVSDELITPIYKFKGEEYSGSDEEIRDLDKIISDEKIFNGKDTKWDIKIRLTKDGLATIFLEKTLQFFKLTDESLEELKSAHISSEALKLLQNSSLKDQDFKSENKFLESIKNIIGDEQTDKHKSAILKSALNKSYCKFFRDSRSNVLHQR